MNQKQETAGDKSEKRNECSDRELFLNYFVQSKIPHPSKWTENSSLYVNASKRGNGISYHLPLRKDGYSAPFPLQGEVVTFCGPLFQGKIVSRVKDESPSTNSSSDHVQLSNNYFKGRSRKFQWIVQGIFSKRTRYDQVSTGQDFGRPFRNAPASPLVKKVMNMLRSRLPDTFECDLFCQEPRFEHPLIAGCQNFRVDNPIDTEQLPIDKLLGQDSRGGIIENTMILKDSSVPKESEQRRKFFSKKENLESHYFEPGLIYTFEFYANFFSPPRYRLEITPFFSSDITPYFNGYPLFMAMAKDKSTGEFLWATEMWHKSLIEYDIQPGFISKFLGSRKSKKVQTS